MPIEIINRSAKDSLARLLAGENLQVCHSTSAETACFDMESRQLTLPVWRDMSHDVIDMLIGHEVGHALFTPAGFAPLNTAIKSVSLAMELRIADRLGTGLPAHATDADGKRPGARLEQYAKHILNVVEDARIEREIQSRFPGLIRNFRIGYDDLVSQDFFGIGDTDPNELSLLDRLNVHFKAGNRIPVSFSTEEMEFVDALNTVSTWEEVVEVSCRLGEYLVEDAKMPEPPQSDAADESTAAAGEDSDDDGTTAESQATTESAESDDDGTTAESQATTESAESDGQGNGQGDDSDDRGDQSSKAAAGSTVNRYSDDLHAILDGIEATAKTMQAMEDRLRESAKAPEWNKHHQSGTLPTPCLDRIVVDFTEILARLD